MKYFTLLALTLLTFSVKAQQAAPPMPTDQPYGKIDQADLEMKACDFEKDANAEVLIDKGDLYYDQTFNIVMDVHERIKIYNDNAKDKANIRLPFEGNNFITDIQGETINLVDGKMEITKLDKKQIYIQNVNKNERVVVFTMPNVKAGCIIDYKYSWHSPNNTYIEPWSFQQEIPVRYSEFSTSIPEFFTFSTQSNLRIPFSKYNNTQGSGTLGSGADAYSYTIEKEQRVLVNVPSINEEPYMSSIADNQLHVNFHYTSFKAPYGMVEPRVPDTWAKVADLLIDDEDFGKQAKRKLTNEDELINKAKALKTQDEKINYLFNAVKNTMKWDGENEWYTNDGVVKAWDAKTGNSTEINLILYHLLKKSGVEDAVPMLVSTKEHGKVNPVFSFLQQFNRTVVYIPVDSTKSYVLDATGKYNLYFETPDNLLNSTGFYLNLDNKSNGTIFLQKNTPVMQSIFINADIKPDGKMAGSMQISSMSYNRINSITRYKTDGETKYIDYLSNKDNSFKISALKLDNLDVDTLPLVQSMSFNLDLAGSDETYIYVNPNQLTTLSKNPFISEVRNSDIDFRYLANVSINGIYSVPAGYNIDALPKSVSMSMPDKSIIFKRISGQQDGKIVVRYTIYYKKSMFFKEDYANLHDFYKKMYELLNEQIVLKKA